ncbi:nucleotide exchange factor GrpE [Thermocoleostomius sinensis]|jgi:molecular chaperone GrpE|uniref:Protein GrpE n=1 Tax=Thermocoleostomius sinensis A174 TaxID=2016057 RepID=A0A9E8ZA92_9CYAN|nr:nucleotide exchange factor GrpE [Thermocoleostomius sinensis]WAL59440.1 nucleotide exchange factor GrpE [Thermocoleostomius sinensis A174]
MDEEKQQENAQGAVAESETVEQLGSEPMSVEPNLSNEAEVNQDQSIGEPTVPPTESTLEPEVEPFDLSPEPSVTVEAVPSVEQDSELRAKVEELDQRVEALKAQLEERNNQYMRLAADFENYRKRTQKEIEEQEQKVKCSTIKELLPVVDNFERARSQIKVQTDAEKNINSSYQGIYKDFVDRLKKIGVAPMRAEGEPFDPSLHEAVMREETDQYPEGTVVEELRRGYVLGDLVLRHAMVKVAAAPEYSGSPEEEQSMN